MNGAKVGNKAMKIKLNNMLKGKERKKEQICKVKIEIDKEDLYTLKMNCKGKRKVVKANKGINVEEIVSLKN